MKTYLSFIIFFNLFAFLPILGQAESITIIDSSLKNFESDGCTMFIDGPPSKPGLWRHCCLEHDMRYWFGGDHSDMDQTDLRLHACVQDIAGQKWADLIYLGVRVGHNSPIKNKSHWSWGWITPRADIKLDKDEKIYIIEEVLQLPYDNKFLEKFIKLNLNN
ncbi:MAG: hypothetical protein Q7U04_09945 [Bacteriovorax sp.]|nr:hypothetical protein [Bacteriovorax sp.]